MNLLVDIDNTLVKNPFDIESNFELPFDVLDKKCLNLKDYKVNKDLVYWLSYHYEDSLTFITCRNWYHAEVIKPLLFSLFGQHFPVIYAGLTKQQWLNFEGGFFRFLIDDQAICKPDYLVKDFQVNVDHLEMGYQKKLLDNLKYLYKGIEDHGNSQY